LEKLVGRIDPELAEGSVRSGSLFVAQVLEKLVGRIDPERAWYFQNKKRNWPTSILIFPTPVFQ
jgi:hypothetical protein